MAYIVGLLKPAERAELEARDWEVEPAPAELVERSGAPAGSFGLVWVDSSMFDVMNGPDWERGTGPLPPPPKLARAVEWLRVITESAPTAWLGECVRSATEPACRTTEDRADAMCLVCEARHHLERALVAVRRLHDLRNAVAHP